MFELNILHYIFSVNDTYPTDPALEVGDGDTPWDPDHFNYFRANIEAIADDLIGARADAQTFAGTDHTASQSTDVQDMLESMRHMIAHALGETNWYDEPAGSLKVHDHSAGEGGAVPWSSVSSGSHTKELHPEYAGAVWTTSLRGASPSGNNTLDRSTDQDVVSYVARNYYETTSSETNLQDYYVALRFTLPEDFTAWATSNAIQIEYRTENATSINCHVDVYIYKSGTASLIASSENNASTAWSTVVIDDSALGEWSAGDIVELYVKLETRSDYYSRVGKLRLNYAS